MADLLATLATTAAAAAVSRVRQPQTLRARVVSVNGDGTTSVRLVGAAADVKVYNGQGATAEQHVLVDFQPVGVARIVEVIG